MTTGSMLLRITATSSNPATSAPGEFSFDTFPVKVGRSPECELTLPDENKYVSSRHAEISLSGTTLVLTDTSANGTYINAASAPVGRGNQTQLSNGDALSMGEFTLQISIQSSPTAVPTQSDDPFADISSAQPSPEIPGVQIADDSDPFAGLEDVSNDIALPKTDEHIDRLEDIGIGPSAWESQPDDPFTSSVGSSSADQMNVVGSQSSATEDDDWAGWIGSIPEQSTPPAQSTAKPVAAPPAPASAPAAVSMAGTPMEALLTAAGLQSSEFSGIDQATLAAHIGKILNRSTLSMMLLLRSRDEIKNAMRADVTLLGAKGNSPLQFSITPEDALKKLLTPSQDSGFADADKALDKGVSDIKIHQLAMLEAMRSALQIALSHFDPEVLEKHAKDSSPLASSLPLAREAKLWEQFQDRYNEIKSDAVDDFSDLFGRELRKAYERSVDNFKRSSD